MFDSSVRPQADGHIKELEHNYSHTQAHPHIHASAYRHIFGRVVKNRLWGIVFNSHFDDRRSRTVYIHCLKSSEKYPSPCFSPPLSPFLGQYAGR